MTTPCQAKLPLHPPQGVTKALMPHTNLATAHPLHEHIPQFKEVGKHLQQLLVCLQSANSLRKRNMTDKTNSEM
jgi:hypothetical protein